jgi:hypothetical protein
VSTPIATVHTIPVASLPSTWSTVWGAEIRFSCREAVLVDQSAEAISSLDTV